MKFKNCKIEELHNNTYDYFHVRYVMWVSDAGSQTISEENVDHVINEEVQNIIEDGYPLLIRKANKKSVVVGPAKTGLVKTDVAGPGVTARTVVVGTVQFLSKLHLIKDNYRYSTNQQDRNSKRKFRYHCCFSDTMIGNSITMKWNVLWINYKS